MSEKQELEDLRRRIRKVASDLLACCCNFTNRMAFDILGVPDNPEIRNDLRKKLWSMSIRTKDNVELGEKAYEMIVKEMEKHNG